MSYEAIAGIITVVFLAWIWLLTRTPSKYQAEAEKRVAARPSSWDQSAEGQMHHIWSSMNETSQPPY